MNLNPGGRWICRNWITWARSSCGTLQERGPGRTDGSTNYLTNFYVFVSDVPFTSNTVAGTLAQTGVSNFHYSGAAPRTTSIPFNRTARYVRVQLAGTGWLELAEVRVFEGALASSTPSLTPTAGPSPTITPTPRSVGNQVWKKYYYAGSARIAMRVINGGSDQVFYLFADHLGGTNVTADPDGNKYGEMRYTAWGGYASAAEARRLISATLGKENSLKLAWIFTGPDFTIRRWEGSHPRTVSSRKAARECRHGTVTHTCDTKSSVQLFWRGNPDKTCRSTGSILRGHGRLETVSCESFPDKARPPQGGCAIREDSAFSKAPQR